MKSAYSYLLSLVRCAFGNVSDETDYGKLSKETWEEIINTAFAQGVAALLADGYQNFLSFHPGKESVLDSDELENLRYELFSSVIQAEDDYQRFGDAIGSLSRMFEERDLKMMVLKGYGLSLDYPIPSHRSLGDIDIFLSDGNIPVSGPNPAALKGDEVFRSMGLQVNCVNSHHSQIQYQGITIENHHFIFDNDSHLSNIRVERKLRTLLDFSRKCSVEGMDVYLPNPTFGILHLLRHSGGDFCTSSLILRQVIDYGMFVRAHHDDIDWDVVCGTAREFCFHRFMDCMNSICVEYLGLDRFLFPTFEEDKSLVGRIANDMFHPEFRDEIPPREKLLEYGIVKTRRMFTNRWKYKLVYEEGLMKSFWVLAKNRIKNKI